MRAKSFSLSDDEFHYLRTGDRPALDLEWFAVDRDGCIAAFTTAGFAEIPALVLSDRDALNHAYDIIAAIPILGRATWVCQPPPRGETWTRRAEQGLFTYDWDHLLAQAAPLPYRMQCWPSEPITVSQLPAEVSRWLAPITFSTIAFAESPEIFVSRHFQEII